MPTKAEFDELYSRSLEMKIRSSQTRIIEWILEWGPSKVSVSFSGGKDSTVVLDLVCRVWKNLFVTNIPTLQVMFVDTGLEYPEIKKFVKWNIEYLKEEYQIPIELTIVRPKMRFDEVIKKYGYPVISKEVSDAVGSVRRNIQKDNMGKETYRLKKLRGEIPSYSEISKYYYLVDAPFNISDRCCFVMKKYPAKEIDMRNILGNLAKESRLRMAQWLHTGCNSFNNEGQANAKSTPIAFWSEDNVLEYIQEYEIPICSVYGKVIPNPHKRRVNKLCMSGVQRTGCVFCMFGAHLDDIPNRFQRLKESHPKQYNYCMGGGEFDENGLWIPNKDGIGMDFVLNYLKIPH